MRISLNWLRDWVATGDDVPALAHTLTMAGLEIEGVERAGPDLPGVIVGEVLTVTRHPDAEKLNVCSVATGGETVQIVCGAPNVRAGMKAPLAMVGANLPGDVHIKKAKLRGVESFGMLCSARELGLNEDASGLMELPEHFTTGEALSSALALDDMLLEINLTPNRGDCMSVAGVAREVAAANGQPLTPPAIDAVPASIDATFPVKLAAGQACSAFYGRVIRGIRADAVSPFWLQERLRRAGLRPISAVVDVTNYVMLELGQPMHAYDLARLSGGIVVRYATPGERLTLLDGREIELTDDVLVIADERAALGMAGVMGGDASGISDATTDVFLEVAYFQPAAIAGRGRRYGLVTDASQRFERGVDPQLQARAIERATALLLECAGGQAGPVVVERSGEPTTAAPIRLRHPRIERLLGASIPAAQVEQLLSRLGMHVSGSAEEWLVQPPSWRFDLHIEADLVEEVARLYGYDNIATTVDRGEHRMIAWTESRVRIERAGDLMVDRGYQEAICYAFTDGAEQAKLYPGEALALSNPLSGELGVMRLSLWPGLLQALGNNLRRQHSRVRLFEIGRRYAADGQETDVIAAVACGTVLPVQWGADAARMDFFDMKSDVEALLALTGAGDSFSFQADVHPTLHPGQCARILRDGQPVGWLGALHPQHAKALGLSVPVFLFELDVAGALAATLPQFQEISRHPAISRDIAVIVDEAVTVQQLREGVHEHGGDGLKQLVVLSVYRGPQLQKGKKSIALGLQLQDTSRTLTDAEADARVAQVVAGLARQLGATLRDS